ncbi:unnamed protein product [Victoria cruziana]
MGDGRCSFFLPKKNRFCANSPLKGSHFILLENLEAHAKKCPLHKQVQALKSQSFYEKGINAGVEDEDRDATLSNPASCTVINELSVKSLSGDSIITSDMKRHAIYKMSIAEFLALLSKINSIHQAIFSNIENSSVMPEPCSRWLKKELNQALPFQEKHALQQASILGNMERFGLLQMPPEPEIVGVGYNGSSEIHSTTPAVVEFGAGRGYLTHMLTSCYNIKKVFLVERRSYKLKADRSLRQEQDVILERLRIDIEDLNLEAVESLRCVPYLAVGKHLCGPATDLTLRCCLREHHNEKAIQCQSKCNLRGLALATCCHHLCQWKSYINRRFLINLGITKEDFHAITWLTSWAVDADHGSTLTDVTGRGLHLSNIADAGLGGTDVESLVKNMKDLDRATLGLICKEIIDIGRYMWLQDQGLDVKLVKYVSSDISPENHLLMAKRKNRV